MWWAVQIAEYVLIVFVLGHTVPASTPLWLEVGMFVLVVTGVFVLNYYVVMPKIGRSSRSQRTQDDV
jgi:hypothetical protein